MGGMMVFDAIRGYLQLASGLTELSRARATEVANAVLNLPTSMASGPMAAQVAALADELLAAATANRASLLALVRSEVENAVGRAPLVPAADLGRARAGLMRLSTELEELRGQVLGSPAVRSAAESGHAAIAALTGHHTGEHLPPLGTGGLAAAGGGSPSGGPGAAPIKDEDTMATRKAAAQVAPTKKTSRATKTATAKETAAKKASSPATKKTTAGESTAGESTAGKSTAGRSTAGRSTAGRSTAGRSTARKASSRATKKTTPSKNTAAKSTAAKSTAGRSTAGRSTAGKSTAGKSTAKKASSPATKKTTPSKNTAAKSTAGRSAAKKESPAKKTAERK